MIFKIFRSKLISMFFILSITFISIMMGLQKSVFAEDIQEIRKQMAQELRMIVSMTQDGQIEDMIGWDYSGSRIMIYYSAFTSSRCGIDDAIWGFTEDKLDNKFPIGVPDISTKEFFPTEYKIAQMLAEENPNGCDPDDPYNSFAFPIYFHLDDYLEGGDSLLALDEESSSVDRIYYQIHYADGESSDVIESKIPNKILRRIEAGSTVAPAEAFEIPEFIQENMLDSY